ncbi:MAG: beta-propeller domain-containing protein [Bifidobacteriaceae bacterium]|jgi:uncharacterized secreted protein with C-terminal beta-propeller domain|nr:beta-propeller domain-containing protein [Bifidobacteriaceae bacterium]
MTDPIFRAMRDQMNPSPELTGELRQRLSSEAGTASNDRAAAEVPDAAHPASPTHVPPRQTRRRPSRRTRVSLLAAGSVAAVALVGTVVYGTLRGPQLDSSAPTGPVVAPAANYSTIYAALEKSWRASEDMGGILPALEGSASGDSMAVPEAGVTDDSSASPGDHTSTNTQVDGIDEGDIVKTDGKTIFVASDTSVALLKADGAASENLSRINAVKTLAAEGYGDNAQVIDLMLDGSVLAVLAASYGESSADSRDDPWQTYTGEWSRSTVLLYDVSDPSSPVLLESFSQDGTYETSRLYGGQLYVVSNHWVGSEDATDPEEPATFTPCLGQAGTNTVMRPRDVAIWEEPSDSQYVVITAIDLDKQERTAARAVLGGAHTVYMSPDNIYIANVQWRTEGLGTLFAQFGLNAGADTAVTNLLRVATGDGELTVAAEGSVPGVPVNQFALDEYESNLRIATTVDSGSTRRATRSALYVLDQDLRLTGKIDELQSDESVQSVRFMGPTGYVVTFRQTDPLFAIDLTDPASPTVMSALKINGFSSYLHPWGKDQLLGLGYQGDGSGLTGGQKLTVFDISDPFDVTVRSESLIAPNTSATLTDHRAIMADPARSMFGFPAQSWTEDNYQAVLAFLVYSADQEGGFSPTATLPFTPGIGEHDYWQPLRGLRVDDFLYVCGQKGADIWEVGSWETPVATVTY